MCPHGPIRHEMIHAAFDRSTRFAGEGRFELLYVRRAKDHDVELVGIQIHLVLLTPPVVGDRDLVHAKVIRPGSGLWVRVRPGSSGGVRMRAESAVW